MAKLTARFDLRDRITKKLRSVRAEAERLERSRAKLNKPLLMTVRDRATRSLRTIGRYIQRDLAKVHRISMVVRDRASGPISSIGNLIRARFPRTHQMLLSARDRATPVLQRVNTYMRGNILKAHWMVVSARDRATPVVRRIATYTRMALSRGYSFTIRAIDMVTRTVGRIASFARTAIPRYRDFTIRAWDQASRVIGTVRRALFSIPTMITVTLAAVGVGSLSKATVGSAMNFEDYGVSMDHWLKDDKKASKKLMKWMGQKADLTPYTSADIFPAMTGAIGMVGNDPDKIKRLTSTAIDMAALTPGSSVEDAMQAIQNAQMGEMTMMKRFGFNISKEDYDDMGFDGFVNEVEKRFEGGALRLSKTGRGLINTLKGYMGSQFREIGDGILDGMKPRLEGVVKWLMDNEKAWGKWKSTVGEAGRQASEWVFSKLETGFEHIKTNYLENKDFNNLDFEGKIKFIMDDLGAWWNKTGRPLLVGVSKDVGGAIFKGVTWGIKEGLKGIGSMWMDAFKNPSVEGFAGAGIATAIAGSILSLVLSPLFKGISGIFKSGKWFWDQGKKVVGLFGKAKGGKVPSPTALPRNPNQPRKSQGNPDYRNPWFNKGEKPVLNTPNQKPFKMPSGLGKAMGNIGNFAKRVPVLGTLLGGLSIATADNKLAATGGVAGGAAGAITGGAIGSAIPIIGTTIGAIIGGIIGAIGGEKIVTWVQSNWSGIKQGASDAGKWVANVWDSTWSAVKGFASGLGEWFTSTVWSPIKDGASTVGSWISDKFTTSKEWVVDAWSSFSDWFDETIWTPVLNGAINTMNFIVGAWDLGKEWILESWAVFTEWFESTVWTPIKDGATAAGEWIAEKYDGAKEWIAETWSTFAEWFNETIWEPVKLGAAAVGLWIHEKYLEAKEWVIETWIEFASWFEETIWTPVKEGATATGLWVYEKYQEAYDWITEKWALLSGWFHETVWNPIKEFAIESATNIYGKWLEIKGSVQETWGTVSGWFQSQVFGPIETIALSVADIIESTWTALIEKITGFYDSAKDMYDKAKEWGSNIVDKGKSWVSDVVSRGESITGIKADTNATGGHITRPTLSWIGEAGNEYVIPTENNTGRGRMLLQQAASDLGMRVSDRDNAPQIQAATTYVDNGTLNEDLRQVLNGLATQKPSGGNSNVQVEVAFTGDNHYSNGFDAEKHGHLVVKVIKDHLEDELNTGGEGIYDL